MNLTWNGQRVDGVEVVRLPANVSLEQAAQWLDAQPDGRDTLGVAGQDGDYLVLGHGLRAPQAGEYLAINGRPVLPAFLEDEASTAAEGFLDPRDANQEGSLIRTGVVAIGGAILGGIAGSKLGGATGARNGARWGAALGSTLGLPIAGMIYENGVKPGFRKITGKPTQQAAQVNTAVIQRLLASGNAYSVPATQQRTLTPVSRSALQAPPAQPVYDPNWRPAQPTQPTVNRRNRGL